MTMQYRVAVRSSGERVLVGVVGKETQGALAGVETFPFNDIHVSPPSWLERLVGVTFWDKVLAAIDRQKLWIKAREPSAATAEAAALAARCIGVAADESQETP